MHDEDKIQELVNKARQGDKNAFGEIYGVYSQPLFNFLIGRIKHKETTEDLLSTVFLKAWSNLKYYKRRENAKFSTWLYQIANYTLIDYWRTRKETSTLDKVDNLSQFAKDLPLYEEYEYLWIAISELPLDYQTVLDLRFKQQLSVSETAQIMKKSEVGIRVMQYRALKILKKKLEQGNYI